MEKAWSHRYSHLWTNDQNSVSAKKIDSQDRIGKGKVARIRIEIEIAEITSINFKKATINIRRKDDPSIWVELITKTETDRSYEGINWKSRVDNELDDNWVLKAEERIAEFQEEVFLPKKARTAIKIRKENSRRLYKGYPSR